MCVYSCGISKNVTAVDTIYIYTHIYIYICIFNYVDAPPKSSIYRLIFYEINHPAIGVLP